MKRHHNTCIAYLHMQIDGVSLSSICQPQPYQLIFAKLSAFILYSMQMSIRMLANLYKNFCYSHYKCIAINKNDLRLLKNMLRICFPYEEHVSNIRKTS